MADIEYGLTLNGPNIKRLDVILDEMHSDLTERWGVNTRQNSQSLINHLLTNIADQIAELWEFGEDVYYSQYPTTAEGVSLDNAMQLGGALRKNASRSVYPLHCTGKDGIDLDTTTTVASVTNPVTYLTLMEAGTLSRSSFNRVSIKIPGEEAIVADTYTVTVDSVPCSITTSATTRLDALNAIKAKLESDGNQEFIYSVNVEDVTLEVVAKDETKSYALGLSENLTTETVTCILNFATQDNGDIYIPDDVITKIVKAPAELISVTNICDYIPGRNVETDAEARPSYIDTLFNRSTAMRDSIRAAIMSGVSGVESVAVYENDTDVVDADGRYPHSIEVVVSCPANQEIYQQIAELIFQYKAGGINTYGNIEKTVSGSNDETLTIRFSIPTAIYVWWKVNIQTDGTVSQLPHDDIKAIIIDYVTNLSSGESVIPQTVFSTLYSNYSYITYIDVSLFSTTNESATPTDSQYTERSVSVSQRNMAVTDATRIKFDD